MKKSFILTLLTIITLGLFRPVTALAEEQKLPSGTERSQIGQKIQDFVKEHEKTTAGMATTVFDKDGTIYQGSFGYMNKEKGIKADDNSVFEWGSVGKLAIWVSVMQLWEEGKIDLDEDIRTYLPEGFMKTLRYDKPVTMTDLMNHQAGFGESTHAYKEDKGLSIEEILAVNQPEQSYEPGTMTAYSNFSASLAAYIVERISGQDFSAYVHEHIFQPLGMKDTALSADFKENPKIYQKRMEQISYRADGTSMGTSYFHLGLYPAGNAVSTLADFQKFAQALLKKEKLFKNAETWTTLYTATSNYPGTDMPLNMHGFWTREYGTTLVGHGGNSTGYSSYILLDLKNGIGMTIMTNQDHELVYNYEMPALVFGPKKKTDSATFDKFQSGNYRSARNFASGPISISRILLYTQFVKKSADNQLLTQNYAVVSNQAGTEKVTAAYGDSVKVKDSDVMRDWIILILAAIGIVFSFIVFLVRGGLDLFRLVFKKDPSKTPKHLRIWTYVTSIAGVAVAVNFALFFSALAVSDLSFLASWRFMTFAGLGLILAICAVYPLLAKVGKGIGKGRLFLTVMTSLSALAIVANILYWSLYQWWAL
ncbi:serine hydrolase domain-containing protein [Streptococcus sanguinis]|uniref:serine hydrolase domain-containing protein n=1 Tax=Streptococcus sanguinis TaxID=1305 RepID=UPI00066C53BF|nr:serine hydrolase domain-containing protein [Streptococcus sanguinis]MCY7028484.1 beta-lactamase family protein [Streptococcus sanguinis]